MEPDHSQTLSEVCNLFKKKTRYSNILYIGTGVLIALIISLSLITIVSIVGLGIGLVYNNDECIKPYNGIYITWPKFLIIHGSVDCVAIGLLIIAFLIHSICKSRKAHEPDDDLNECCGGFIGCVLVLTLFFQFIWFILGGILYFHDVGGIDSACPKDGISYQFGLAWFCIDLIAWVIIILAKIY